MYKMVWSVDPFSPATLFHFLVAGLILFAFDRLGGRLIWAFSLFARHRSGSSESRSTSWLLRPLYWIIGLGGYSAIWFLLHFFLPFSPLFVLGSLLILVFIGKTENLDVLARWVLKSFLYLLALVPILPALWTMISLPPHRWDELRYHYY